MEARKVHKVQVIIKEGAKLRHTLKSSANSRRVASAGRSQGIDRDTEVFRRCGDDLDLVENLEKLHPDLTEALRGRHDFGVLLNPDEWY